MNTEKEPEMNSAAVSPEAETEKTAAAAEAAQETAEAAQETAETAEKAADGAEKEPEEPEKKEKKKKLLFLQSEKFKHGSIATAFTAGFIAVVVLLNVIVGILGDRYPSVNLDITKSNNNTLSTEAAEIVDKVTIPVEITICATKAACENGSVTSSGGDYSEVNSLLAKAAERNSNITLKYVDLDQNPTFSQQYKSDSLTTGDVIVKSAKRYRVLTSSDLFTSSYDSSTYSYTYYSNVDASIASALNNVISEAVPVVAFETGHSEQMDTTGYKKLLGNASFETKEFSLLTDEIPAGTQILVLGCPTTDFTEAEIKKIETYLHDTSTLVNRTLLVTASAGQGGLTTLDAYLSEWGLSAAADSVIAETSSSKYYSNQLMIFSDVDSDDITLKSSGTTYSNLLTPYASPVTLQGKSVGMKSLYALVNSSSSSVVLKTSSTTTAGATKQASTVVGLSMESVKSGTNTFYANVILSGSTLMFSSSNINATVLGNSQYLTDLSRYATGTTDSATSVVTTKRQLYASDITVTESTVRWIGVGLFTVLLPLAVAIAGIIVYRRRRTL